ncbi:MAG TPA: winged helix-turn-helix transcriptional regulator [Desulfotomaculum sp.]|nr:winged helix-turn-helix transcriptional regulator [Desulfotomaculum sp.]
MEAEVYNQSTFLILKAAYLYYLKDKQQNEIADMLNISVPTVSRLIKKAKEEKIVEFVIRNPYIDCLDMEEKLKKAFNLRDVVVAPIPSLGTENAYLDLNNNVNKLVALEGARYIQRIISEKDVLGISWGKTMYNLIHYLNPCQKVNATFVTMHGSISGCHQDMDVKTLVSRMAMSFGGKNYFLLTEGLMSNAEAARYVRNEKNVRKVFDIFNQITISLTSVGSFYPNMDSLLYKQGGYLTNSEINQLKSKGLVGDIILRFIDSDGNECDTDLRERTVGIGLDVFKNIKTKITIASGETKAYALKSALKGGLIDILIIDYNLGKRLLDIK